MMNPKSAIIKDNLTRAEADRIPVKEGKGRMSKAADERCRELAAQGWDIKGYAVAAPATTAAPAEVKKAVAGNEKVIRDFVILYEEKLYTAKATDGKSYGMRECCNNCRVSLVQCHCGKPTILGDIKVVITPK